MKNDKEDLTSYERGFQVGLTGIGIAPSRFPTPSDDWSTRLYFRGWEAGRKKANKNSKNSTAKTADCVFTRLRGFPL